MSLLNGKQKTDIGNGLTVSSDLWLYGPEWKDGIYDAMGQIADRVIDFGSREQTLYNVSLQSPGELSAQTWTIVVDNSDGLLYTGVTNSFFYSFAPTDCAIRHTASIDGDYLPYSGWTGRITNMEYHDVVDSAGVIQPNTVTMTMEGVPGEYLRRLWTKDHGDAETKPHIVTPSGVAVTNMTAGWDLSGSTIRIWVQFNTSVSCTGRGKCYWSLLERISATAGTLHQLSFNYTGVTPISTTITPTIELDTGSIKRILRKPEIPLSSTRVNSSARPW
jgi:hypothetical protein